MEARQDLAVPLSWVCAGGMDASGPVRRAGTFKLTLTFTEEYPNKAPVVKFKSHMFHPNSARRTGLHAPTGPR